jgi:hypothetical protein
MIKTVFKLFLCTIVYTIAYLIANAVMPYSPGLKELGDSESFMALVFMLLNAAWICFTIYFIIKHTHYYGKKLFGNLLFVIFFVQMFMTQIETLLFGNVFPALKKPDVALIMAAGLIPLLAVIPLLIKLFRNKDIDVEIKKINVKSIITRLGITGIVYCCLYMIFGYFVAWQFEELRIFYTGSVEKLSFFMQLAANNTLIPIQTLRGILFGIFILPLYFMLGKSKTVFITGVCLVYLCPAIMLITPSPLFPDIVRYAHLIEMTSSMLLFGILAGNLLWGRRKFS